ncbi:MAG: IMP dehydrogenase [Crenarchaeota archaeon]|nr:IMP dehydrogenase [Thermoproteota archaeon]
MVFREKLPSDIVSTFNDVILVPGFTEVEPIDVDVSTYVSRNVRINIPIVSSPMDTVTEHEMAIALARLGGIGIVHRNMTTERQLEEVRKVKEAPQYPVYFCYVEPSIKCRDVLKIMKELSVEYLPVVSSGRVVGFIRKIDCVKYPDDRVVEHARSPVVASLYERPEELRSIMIDNDVDIVALVDSSETFQGIVTIWVLDENRPFIPCLDDEGRLRVGAAISPFDRERIRRLDKYVDVLVLDVANAANLKIVESLREICKDVSADLVIGNVGTYESAVELINRIERIDGFRVGIASGSICSTGIVTGVAAPTLWATAQVADAALEYGLKVPIIADGGVKSPGDAVKAFAVGAWCVMLGRVLAQAYESPSPVISIGDRKYKYYRGMASEGARTRRYAVDRYSRKVKDISEGVEGLVPYRGPLETIVKEFVSGIQAAMGYIGVRNIQECWRKARLMRVSSIGRGEVEPHSIFLKL